MRRVVVLKGGISAEREVSLNTGAQVAAALRAGGTDVAEVDTGQPGFIADIESARADAAFICLHGRWGEDGTVQGLLELMGLPYVGSGVLSSAMAMDKAVSKIVYDDACIPTPPYAIVRRGQNAELEAVADLLGDRTVVKPASEGSAIGVTIVHSRAELPAAVEEAFRHDRVALIERFVEGTEVTVGVLGNDDPIALPTLEVVPEHEFYDFESKYVPGMSRHIIPARVSEPMRAECARLSLMAHTALGCRGMSRSDVIVTPEDEVWLLETNTIPGMTSTSLFPEAARAAGIEFPDLVERLVRLALEDRG